MATSNHTAGEALNTGTAVVILASASAARQTLLEQAGVLFQAIPAFVDEDEIKRSMRADGADGAAIAEALAEIKAQQVSNHHPDAVVIGADQVLQCDGEMFDKPHDMADARNQLCALRGRWHELVICACVVQGGVRQWHHVARARLLMRSFSDDFLETYLETAGDEVLAGPGAYQIERLGAQLFARLDGDHATILGLPLLPVLDYLRGRQVLSS